MPQLGPQFEQLAMFHPAKDFVGDTVRNTGRFYPMDVEAYEPAGGRSRYGQMWHEKRAEAAAPSAPGRSDSLKESIQKHGVRDPIEVYHYDDENRNPFDPADRGYNQPATWNGHHRAIVTHDLHGPNALVPVVHQDQYNEDWLPPRSIPR